MKLVVNGEQKILPESALTVAEFLEKENIPPQRVTCELNGKILKRSQWAEAALQEGDVLEIITLVGGG